MRKPSLSNRNSRQKKNCRTGVVTVETAFVVPIVFTIFLGAVELTTMNIMRNTASNAAYEAARKAALPGGDLDEAETDALATLTALGFADGADVQINMTADTAEAVISVPMEGNSWGLTRFSGGLTIVKSCKLTREQAL